MDWHTRGKWLIHGPKHLTGNQSKSLMLADRSKYLSFSESSNIICSPDLPATVVLSCPGGQGHIDIQWANWGRSQPNDTVCPSSHAPNDDTHCFYPLTFFGDCETRTYCDVAVAIPATDPCPGTYKYVEVMYLCHGGYAGGVILGMGSVSMRRCYIITSSLMGSAHTHNGPWYERIGPWEICQKF